jgi:predicted ribosome quality control (RQC) complex YloA/Tae2 family protein
MPESSGATKDRFTGLDTLALVLELRAIERARVDKIFDRPGGGYLVVFRVPTEGRRSLAIVPGRFAALVAAAEPAEELSPLARELRRLLTGTRLSAVAEPAGERYLELELMAASADPPLLLAVELFGAGNVIVARDGRILAVQRTKTWAHRAVRVGAPYARPPAHGDPWRLSPTDIELALSGSRTDRVSTLAARLAFGGPLAEELLARGEVPPGGSAPTDAPSVARSLHAAMEQVAGEVGASPKGFLYRRGAFSIDVEPFPAQRFRRDPEVSEEAFPTFSQAALAYFGPLAPPSPPSATPSPALAAIEEWQRQREQQRAAVEALQAEADARRTDAETLLTHFPEAEAALARARASPSEAHRHAVELRVADRAISVRVDGTIRAAAQALFEEAQVLRTKLNGARAALAETERKLTEPPPAPAHRAAKGAPEAGKARTPRWFERYRWFLSSERILVIGGRDAASNDLIVRRYLKPTDRYVHADIHGAPSVIVKHPVPGAPPPTEATMREAGQWGVAFSRAWRAGLASASAFWVEADQVSKSAASGEFVARGAWVIHGTKNAMRDLPTELAIGPIEWEGETLWMVAPPTALARLGEPRYLLTPGEERDRAEREIELARELGLSRSRLQALLPSGGLSVRRA